MSPVDPSEVVLAARAARPVGPSTSAQDACRVLMYGYGGYVMCVHTRSCAINHLLRSLPRSLARSHRISEQVPRSALCNFGEVPVGGVTLAAWSCLFMLTDSEV